MMIDKTILRQYGNSPAIKKIIYSFDDGMKITNDIDNFYTDIFNLDTAKSYGLDCWGKIVNVSRYVKFDSIGSVAGFYGQHLETANNGAFYSGKNVNTTLKLSDDFFRKVIKSKAAANISDCTIKDLNRILNRLYPNKGNVFVVDNLNMSMHYVFSSYLEDNEIALIKNSNVLPRPSGVYLLGVIVEPEKMVGFYGSDCQTMNNGTFFTQKGIINVN